MISITDYGASTSSADNTAAIQAAINAAKAAGTSVYIPEGVFKHAGVLRLDGVDMSGAGDKSVLLGTNPEQEAIIITGSGVDVSNLKLQDAGGARQTTYESGGFAILSASNFTVDHVTIDHASGAGFHITGSTNGSITNNVVSYSGADSIHMSNYQGGNAGIEVAGNRIDHGGDDGVAVVSYAGNTYNSGINIHDNAVVDQIWGRGYTVVGGQNVQIHDNFYNNNMAGYAGIYIAAESEWNTLGVDGVVVSHNIIENAGGNHGSIQVYASSGAVSNVSIDGNQIYESRNANIVLNGSSQTNNIDVTNNTSHGSQTFLAQLDGAHVDQLTGNQALGSTALPTWSPLVPTEPTTPPPTTTQPTTPPPTTTLPPDTMISIADYGASTSSADNTAAIQAAINAAKAAGTSVYIPEGVFKHAGVLRLDGVDMSGAGDKSVLQGTNPEQEAIIITGSGVDVSNLKLQDAGGARQTTYESGGFAILSASNFTVDHVTIDHASGAGFHITGSTNGSITNNVVSYSGADSIHMSNYQGGNAGIEVAGNRIDHAGDDGVAVVSYAGNTYNSSINIHDNAVVDQIWGRGYTVVGGQNVQIHDNFYNNNMAGYAGIYIAAESEWNTLGVNGVVVSHNIIENAGGNHGSIQVYASSGAVSNVSIDGNQIYKSRNANIVLNGSSQTNNIDVTNNTSYGSQTFLAQLDGAHVDQLTGNQALGSTALPTWSPLVPTEPTTPPPVTTPPPNTPPPPPSTDTPTDGLKLYGTAKADYLLGTDGNDTLIGGRGSDTITGGGGDDNLWGNFGRDVFHFDTGDSGLDKVSDFVRGQDKIDIHDFGSNWLALQTIMHDSSAGLIITLGAETITVAGVHNLASGDFIL